MFNYVHGKYIYIAYYPEVSSTAIPASSLSRDARAVRLDLMTFDPQFVSLVPANIWFPKQGTGPNSNNSVINSRVYWSTADGQVSIASDNATSNATTVTLFTVRVRFN